MKTKLALILVFSIILFSSGIMVSANDDPFAGKTNLNVVYLGGSITAGAGATATENKTALQNNWVSQVGDYLNSKFTDKTIIHHNVGLGGTGSNMGLLRLQKDVISKNPDMVFIEFAVNDGGSEASKRYMESIVLSLQQLDPIPYIVYVYTTRSSLNVDSSYHKAVADFYGIPAIDLQSIILNEQGENASAFAATLLNADGVHPNNTGYAYYAQKIIAAMETGSYYARPAVRSDKLVSASAPFIGKFNDASSATYSGGWTVSGAKLTASAAGETIKYNFTGSVISVRDYILGSGGKYTITIDGTVVCTRDTFYANVNQPALGYVNFDLASGKHTLVITVLSDKNGGSSGTDVSIENFITRDFELQPNVVNAGIFSDYVNSQAPEIESTIEKTTNNNVTIHRLRFYSRQTDETNRNIVYTIVAYPSAPGTYPGLMVLHGGTQTAQSVYNRVVEAASMGYIAIAPELPGIASPTNAVNSSGAWRNEAYEARHLVNSTNPTDSVIYDAVIAALEGLHLLQSNNAVIDAATGTRLSGVSVDPNNIGITGISWGGYMSTMVAGILSTQVKAVFSNYGSGFYDTSSYWTAKLNALSSDAKACWLENFDAGRRAKNITADYFIAAAADDAFFHPPAVMATINEIPAPTNMVFSPNTNHTIGVPGGTGTGMGDPNGCSMEDFYFGKLLKGEGVKMPEVKIQSKSVVQNTGYSVRFNIDADESYIPGSVKLMYSSNSVAWPQREWKELDSSCITADGSDYVATIPLSLLESSIDFYILASDSRPVSVSSMIYTVSSQEAEDAATEKYLTPVTIDKQAEYPSSYYDTTIGNTWASMWTADGKDFGDLDVLKVGTDNGIVSFAPNEWMNYSVTVDQTAKYRLYLTQGTTKEHKFNVKVNDGLPKAGNAEGYVYAAVNKSFAATGAYDSYRKDFICNVNLRAGENIIRIENVSTSGESIAVDSLSLEKVINTGDEEEIIYEAADYNPGGQDVGYYDTAPTTTIYFQNGDNVDMALENNTVRALAVFGGEWFKYDIIVQKAARYKLIINAGNPSPYKVGVSVNDRAVRVLSFPATGEGTSAYQIRPDTYVCDIYLNRGKNTLKLSNSDSGGISITQFKLKNAMPQITGDEVSRIEAEHYNAGGEGVSYHDTSAGIAFSWCVDRGDDVEAGLDNAGTGLMVSFAESEWLKYDVNVLSAGEYNMKINAALGETRTPVMQIFVDDKAASSSAIEQTADWKDYKDFDGGNLKLTYGKHTIKLLMQGSINYDYFTLERVGDLPIILEAESPTACEPVMNAGTALKAYTFSNASGGYAVGFNTNCWISFNTNIPADGKYRLTATGFAAMEGKLKIIIDSVEKATGDLPNTGSWSSNDITDTVLSEIDIAKGNHNIKFAMTSGAWTLDCVKIEKIGERSPIYNINMQAEAFDLPGGEGVGFHDNSPNGTDATWYNQAYSPVEVGGANGGLVVGFDIGEWLKYDISTTQAGDYNLQICLGGPNNMYFEVDINGLKTEYTTENTGTDWSNATYKTVNLSDVYLNKGSNTIIFKNKGSQTNGYSSFNFDYFTLSCPKIGLYLGEVSDSTAISAFTEGHIIANAELNGLYAGKNVILAVAVYKNGILENIYIDEKSDEADTVLTKAFDVTNDGTSVYKMKLFLWNDLSSAAPYMKELVY